MPFLKTYPAETTKRYRALARRINRSYPSVIDTLMDAYADAIANRSYNGALKAYLDTFEVTVQFATAVMLRRMDNARGVANLETELRTIRDKTLSFGRWCQVFLKVAKAASDWGDPLAVSFMRRHRKSSFAKEFDSISRFRNTGFGHDTMQSNVDAKAMLDQHESCLYEFLDTMAPLADLALFTVCLIQTDAKVHEYSVRYQTEGLIDPRRFLCRRTLDSDGVYYVERTLIEELEDEDSPTIDGAAIISLPPFVVFTRPALPQNTRAEDRDAQRVTYIYQTRTDKTDRLCYVTAEGHPRKETSAYTPMLQDFLNQLIESGVLVVSDGTEAEPDPVTIPEPLTWRDVFKEATREADDFVANMAKKYSSDLYVPRRSMHSALHAFLEHGERRGLVILGESGVGKTNLLCNVAAEWQREAGKRPLAVVPYYCKTFATVDLAEQIPRTFGRLQPLPDVLRDLDEAAAEVDGQVLFLFDAVNECLAQNSNPQTAFTAPVQLISWIDELLVANGHDRVKVALSCRNYTWEEACSTRGHGVNSQLYFTTRDLADESGENTDGISLGCFTEAEFAEAYSKYRDRYNLATELVDIIGRPFQHRQLLDPLRLRLVAECYEDNEDGIPEGHVDSLALLERQVAEIAGIEEVEVRDDAATILAALTRLLWAGNFDAIPIYRIKNAVEAPVQQSMESAGSFEAREMMYTLRRHLYDPNGRTKAFDALVEEGILRVEEATSFRELRFVYERVHEFLLGKEIHAGFSGERQPAAVVQILERALGSVQDYAVTWGAIRVALQLHYRTISAEATTTPSTQRERISSSSFTDILRGLAASRHHNGPAMVTELIEHMAREDYESAFGMIGCLLDTPAANRSTQADLLAAGEALDKLHKKLRERKKEASEATHAEYTKQQERRDILEKELRPVVRGKLHAIKTLVEIYRSRLYADNLYGRANPLDLLWKALDDPLPRVRDAATRHLYYLWKADPDIATQILDRLATLCQDASFWNRYGSAHWQGRLEPCGKLAALVLCELLLEAASPLDESTPDSWSLPVDAAEQLQRMQATWRDILRQFMVVPALGRPVVIRLVKPIVKRAGQQISEFVNNVTEYRHFWEEIPQTGSGYTKQSFAALVPFLDPNRRGFEAHHDLVIEGARLGDAMNNFLLERVLIAQGVTGYERTAEVVDRIYHNEHNELPKYTQMSMLYVVFHTLDKMPAVPEGPFEQFTQYMEPWTQETAGFFPAYYHREANRGRYYKQYTLNWYGALHSKLYGDGEAPLELFEMFLQQAFDRRDSRLFQYAVDNIAMLAADFGHWRSALRTFDFALDLFKTEDDLHRFQAVDLALPDEQQPTNPGELDVRTCLGRALGTIRGYFGREVDRYILDELRSNTLLAADDRLREELLRYDPSERLGDLLTHRFGNLFVQGVVSIPPVRTEVQAILAMVPESTDENDWLRKLTGRVLDVSGLI
jgi:hypothetical protein